MKLGNVISYITGSYNCRNNRPAVPRNAGLTDTTRRDFLRAGTATCALALSPFNFLLGEETQKSFSEILTEQFNSLVAAIDLKKPGSTEQFEQQLEQFLTLTRTDLPTFINWYKTSSQNAKSGPTADFVLESIGRTICKAYENGLPPETIREILEQEKSKLDLGDDKTVSSDEIATRQGVYLGDLLGSYAKVIERNGSSYELIANALGVADELMLTPLRTLRSADRNIKGRKEIVADTMGSGIITVYDAALKGVRKLSEKTPSKLDGRLKQLVFEPLWDIEQMDDRPDLQDRYITILTDNFFGIPQNQGDVEGLELLLKRVAGSNSELNNTAAGWSPYSLMGVMQKNKPWFETAVKSCADRIRGLKPPPSNAAVSPDYLDVGMNALKFLKGSSLCTMRQSFYFTGQDNQSHIPPAPVPGTLPVPPLPEENTPQNESPANVQPTNESTLKAGSIEITQAALNARKRHKPMVPQDRWLDVIGWSEEKLAKPLEEAILFRVANERVTSEDKVKTESAFVKVTERYVDDKGWKELCCYFKALAAIPVVSEKMKEVFDGRLNNLDEDPFMREAVLMVRPEVTGKNYNEYFSDDIDNLRSILADGSLQEIRGLGYVCQKGLKHCNNGISESAFRVKLTKVFEAKKAFDNFPTIDAAEYSRLPKEEQEKRNAAYNAVSENAAQALSKLSQEKLSPPQRLIVEALELINGDVELARSFMPDRKFEGPREGLQFQRDARALFRLFHNAFLLLSYTASQYGDDYIENKSANDRDTFDFKYIMSALLERSLRLNLTELGGPNRAEKWGEKYGAMMDLYESFYLENRGNNDIAKIKGAALGGVFFGNPASQKDTKDIFDVNVPLFEDLRTQKMEHKNICAMKAQMIQGVLNTAGNRGFVEARRSLKTVARAEFEDDLLLDPDKYMKSIYEIDMESPREKERADTKAELKERAKRKKDLPKTSQFETTNRRISEAMAECNSRGQNPAQSYLTL